MGTVVILSGGMDSYVALLKTLESEASVHCISFDYGQSHSIELGRAVSICKELCVDHHIVKVPVIDADSHICGNGEGDVVTNRNAQFILLAHSYAVKKGASSVVGGWCSDDFNGFLDCRPVWLTSYTRCLNVGSGHVINLVMPLINMTKVDMFLWLDERGLVEDVTNKTITCYKGDTTVNKWGAGCGKCNSCKNRRKAWESFIQQKHMVMTTD